MLRRAWRRPGASERWCGAEGHAQARLLQGTPLGAARPDGGARRGGGQLLQWPEKEDAGDAVGGVPGRLPPAADAPNSGRWVLVTTGRRASKAYHLDTLLDDMGERRWASANSPGQCATSLRRKTSTSTCSHHRRRSPEEAADEEIAAASTLNSRSPPLGFPFLFLVFF